MNEHLTINNERLTMGEVSKRNILTIHRAYKHRHCSLLISNCSLLTLLLSVICFASCDLFTGPKVDLFQVISDEVDWANAEKLTVRLEYPSAWGTSNPVQGALTPAMDIRKGYEFSLEFTPDPAYTLQSWMVFLTSELDGLTDSGSWVESPNLITDSVKTHTLGLDDVTLSAPIASGGTFKFIIHTAEPVTIIPWCDTQPRITRTEPRNRPDGQPYSRASDIVLYFNCALNDKTVKFATSSTGDGIWITAKSANNVPTDNNANKWFYEPEYAASGGFFIVTMRTSSNLPPANSLMTVTVKGIKNVEGESMDKAGYSFSWNTSAAVSVNLTSYTATYNSANGNINISWVSTGADNVVTNYRLNNGGVNTLTNSATVKTANITGVNKLNDSGVREGMSVSGIEEYTIFIELYAEGIMESRTTFKIWNFPGMSVSNTNQVVEIKTMAELAAMKDGLSKQYVLANDIAIPNTGTWVPIGSDSNPFKGKLYGASHTITLNGGFNGNGDLGLFGYAEGATIRDLTLAYNNTGEINVAPSLSTPFEMYQANINPQDPPNESFITFSFKALKVGGLAGHLKNSNVSNIITSGGTIKVKSKYISGSVDIPGMGRLTDGGVLLGGIAGYVEGGAIENCRAALSTQYTPDSQQTLMGVMSAIAGIAAGGSIKKVTIDAKVDINAANTVIGVIGGAVGVSQRNTLTDITFSAGTVLFSGTSSMSVCAGIAGMSSMVTMEGCSFLGDITANTDAEVTIGGLVGFNETNSGRFSNCWVQGNINLTGNGSPTIGGFLGASKNRGDFTIENCSFNGGNITVKSAANVTEPDKERRPDIGGFCGSLGGKPNLTIKNCGALSGTITVNVIGILRVGGFISYIEGRISDSFSRMDIVVESDRTSNCRVGGFSGMLTPGSQIDKCFAAGTVSVVTKSVEKPIDGSNTPGQPSVGGLVGDCQGTIQNSYALGNVVLSDSGEWGPAAAGGLVGRIDDGSISKCFSAGRVSSQYTYLNTEGAFSGGIAGISYKPITYTAALGASVTARGDVRSVGRIIGDTPTGLNNNYALKTMSIEEGTGNATYFSPRPANSNLTGKDGQDTDSSIFSTPNFWKTTLQFDKSVWNFSRVAKDGYPRLAWEQ